MHLILRYILKLIKLEGQNSLGWYFNKQNKSIGHSCCASSQVNHSSYCFGNILFGTTRTGTLPTKESCIWKDDLQRCATNNKNYNVHKSWFLETNSALTPHIPTGSRAQPASNCRGHAYNICI